MAASSTSYPRNRDVCWAIHTRASRSAGGGGWGRKWLHGCELEGFLSFEVVSALGACFLLALAELAGLALSKKKSLHTLEASRFSGLRVHA